MSEYEEDPSEFTTPRSGMSLWKRALVKSLEKNVFGKGYSKGQFRAVVLSTPVPMEPSSQGKDEGKWKFFGRIIGPNSPHVELYDDPCDPDYLADRDAADNLISWHTEFRSLSVNERPSKGDEVLVKLKRLPVGTIADRPYDLKIGSYLEILVPLNQRAAAYGQEKGLAAEECAAIATAFDEAIDWATVGVGADGTLGERGGKQSGDFGQGPAGGNADLLRCYARKLTADGKLVLWEGSPSQISSGGDITPDAAMIAANMFKLLGENPATTGMRIRISAGNDIMHQNIKEYRSRHTRGIAIDFALRPKPPPTADILAVFKVLSSIAAADPNFKFIDEYRYPTTKSTGGHFHITYGAKWDWESTRTLVDHKTYVNQGLTAAIIDTNILQPFVGKGNCKPVELIAQSPSGEPASPTALETATADGDPNAG